MAIYRLQKKEKDFLIVDKGFVNDRSLSLEATGLLLLMLSLPDDWQFRVNDLVNRKSNGRDSFRSALKELEAAGYVVREQTRENGKFGAVDYIVHEVKPESLELTGFSPQTGKPTTVKPKTEKPAPENPTLLNNKELKNKELNINTDDDKGPPAAAAGERQQTRSLFDTYYLAFGKPPTPIQIDKLHAYLEDGLSLDLICLAIEKAALANAGINYALKVLSNLHNDRIFTLADYEAQQTRRNANHGQNGRSHAEAREKVERPRSKPAVDLSDIDLSEIKKL